jgi:hypothetical protein
MLHVYGRNLAGKASRICGGLVILDIDIDPVRNSQHMEMWASCRKLNQLQRKAEGTYGMRLDGARSPIARARLDYRGIKYANLEVR